MGTTNLGTQPSYAWPERAQTFSLTSLHTQLRDFVLEQSRWRLYFRYMMGRSKLLRGWWSPRRLEVLPVSKNQSVSQWYQPGSHSSAWSWLYPSLYPLPSNSWFNLTVRPVGSWMGFWMLPIHYNFSFNSWPLFSLFLQPSQHSLLWDTYSFNLSSMSSYKVSTSLILRKCWLRGQVIGEYIIIKVMTQSHLPCSRTACSRYINYPVSSSWQPFRDYKILSDLPKIR